MSRRKNRWGFTLIEILIVLVVIGVLASLAIPMLAGNVNRTYRVEALSQIDAIRSSLARYYTQNGATYVGATWTAPATLDYDPAAANQGGQTQHFTYTLGGIGQNAYTITAKGVAPAGIVNQTVVVNEKGVEVGSTLT